MKNSQLPGFYKSVLAGSVATILDRDLGATIQHWMELVENDNELTCIPLSFEDRAGHIPNLIAELKTLPGPRLAGPQTSVVGSTI